MDANEAVEHSLLDDLDSEVRRLPDGYLHASELRASPSRGVLSIFSKQMHRLLTVDLEEEPDED